MIYKRSIEFLLGRSVSNGCPAVHRCAKRTVTHVLFPVTARTQVSPSPQFGHPPAPQDTGVSKSIFRSPPPLPPTKTQVSASLFFVRPPKVSASLFSVTLPRCQRVYFLVTLPRCQLVYFSVTFPRCQQVCFSVTFPRCQQVYFSVTLPRCQQVCFLSPFQGVSESIFWSPSQGVSKSVFLQRVSSGSSLRQAKGVSLFFFRSTSQGTGVSKSILWSTRHRCQ